MRSRTFSRSWPASLPSASLLVAAALFSRLALAATPSAADPGSAATAKSDSEIEAGLPEIEAARIEGRLLGIHAGYQDRTDRAGKVLAAWSIADDQECWNALRALTTFDRPEVWADLGTAAVYLRWKTYDQAKASLDRARARTPQPAGQPGGPIAELAVLTGDLARLQGDPAAAAAAYRAALALRPTDSLALDGLGLLASAPSEALKFFSAARASFADDPVAVRGQVEARAALGDAAGALAGYDDLHRLLPGEANSWVASAKLRLKAGDASAAARDFEAARKLGSSDPELLALLSESYRVQGRADEERRLLDDLIDQGMAGPVQFARRAELRELSDAQGALADLAKAQQLTGKAGDAGVSLAPQLAARRAALTAKVGTLSEAIGLYRELVKTQPDQKPTLAALEARASLGQRPIKGTVNQINSALLGEVNRLFKQLVKQNPALGGMLKIRVTVLGSGIADSVDFLEDSVKSPELAANLRWNAQDARYPPQANRYVFKFVLKG